MLASSPASIIARSTPSAITRVDLVYQHLPRTENAAAREVTLPLYPTMGDDAVQLVAGAVMKALQHQPVGSQIKLVSEAKLLQSSAS